MPVVAKKSCNETLVENMMYIIDTLTIVISMSRFGWEKRSFVLYTCGFRHSNVWLKNKTMMKVCEN